jgi:fused signal recognition particle receptor
MDLLIVDTAGRLHTKTPLMDELAKIKRVIEKEGSVQEVLLVIDASAGQNGLVQAREFASASDVTGVVLTKLDGTAKGGIALAIEDTLGIPIKLIGVGESVADLQPFDPKSFIEALLA